MLLFFPFVGLVEEIPADTHSEYSTVKRVVRGEEIVFVALSCIDVTHHHKESCMLDVNIGVSVDNRVVSYLHVVLTIALYYILSHVWGIVRCLVTGEIASVCP